MIISPSYILNPEGLLYYKFDFVIFIPLILHKFISTFIYSYS